MSSPEQARVRNRLLSAMSDEDFGLLAPNLEARTFALSDVLAEPDQPIGYVHFLESGLASQIALTPASRRLEVGIYGRDGVGPSPTILGVDRSPYLYVIQSEGQGFTMPVDSFTDALARSRSLHAFMLLYVQAFTVQMAYTALSNGSNVIGERLARWLLMCHDRLDGDDLPLTQEFLGVMLGVRRAGVSDALRDLEQTHVIRTARGRIEVLDRPRLETAAGGSYGVPESEYERLVSRTG